jgi:hypothetical protein
MALVLNTQQQKDVYKYLQNHFYVILNAPCKHFEGYPFKWNDGENNVSITAIIENFQSEQQTALIANCNKMLRNSYGRFSADVSITKMLSASNLQRDEGGVQFNAKASTEHLMDQIKTCACADLWGHVKKYPDFLMHCQIRFDIQPFGGTDINVVKFIARAGVPIVVMLWLLRQLEFYKESEACGLGKVIVISRNGLPEDGDEHNLHFGSGFINWG